MPPASEEDSREARRHRRLAIILVAAILAFFGFGFALVPLYNTFCKLTGLNGKTGGPVSAAVAAEEKIDATREVRIDFASTVMPGLHWRFRPAHNEIEVHPGAITTTSYVLRNPSGNPATGQAIMSVSPGVAARYLRKLECFCFHQQTLKAGESRKMPLVFFVSPDLPKDVHTITLSYAFFTVKKGG